MTDQIAHDYKAGATLRELGRRYGYSHTQIATILERAGVSRRHTWGRMRICPVCQSPFPANHEQIHCSARCYQAARAHVELT